MSRLSVRTVEVKSIVPAEATQPHMLFLTCFDIHMWHCPYMKRILFYPPLQASRQQHDGGSGDEEEEEEEEEEGAGSGESEAPTGRAGPGSFADLVAALSSSLAQTLVLFYPYAGRMRERQDGQRPSVECNDAGVLFFIAEASICLDDLGPALEPDPDVFPDLIHCGHTRSVWDGPTELSDLPLLFVQVTRFLCGGISLGLAYNQVVSDGTAFWSFVRTWSEVCGRRRLSMVPDHARDLLRVTDLTTEIDPVQFHSALYSFFDPWDRLAKKRRDQATKAAAAAARGDGADSDSAAGGAASVVVPMLEEPQVHRIFFFSAETIERLKEVARSRSCDYGIATTAAAAAAGSSGKSKLKGLSGADSDSASASAAAACNGSREEEEAGGGHGAAGGHKPSRGEFTSLEVLGAHLWRCTIKAQNPARQSQTKFVIESDCRRRLPFLPDSFFGNAVCRTAAVTSVQELVDSPLYLAAKLIHKARRRSVSEHYIRTLVHFSEQRGNLRVETPDPCRHSLTTAIQNSSKHPVYECDFGWGRPLKVRSGNLDDDRGAYAIFPGDPQAAPGGVEVGVVLGAGDMARLEQDPSFLLQA